MQDHRDRSSGAVVIWMLDGSAIASISSPIAAVEDNSTTEALWLENRRCPIVEWFS